MRTIMFTIVVSRDENVAVHLSVINRKEECHPCRELSDMSTKKYVASRMEHILIAKWLSTDTLNIFKCNSPIIIYTVLLL